MCNIKTLLPAVLLMFAGFSASSQTTTLPKTQTSGKTIPSTVIKPILPADLQLPAVVLLAAQKNDSKKMTDIKIRVSIRNSGQQNAAASVMSAEVQNTTQGAAWIKLPGLLSVPPVKPGETLVREFDLQAPYSVIAPMYFKLRLKADAGNTIAEGNEKNNFSQGILIAL